MATPTKRPQWQPGTINYVDTFIAVAPDCPAAVGVIPPVRGGTVPAHRVLFDLLTERPYALTHEDAMWQVHVRQKGLTGPDADTDARAAYFATSRACFRSSALPKSYGWGLHFDADGLIALYPIESDDYRRLSAGDDSGPAVVAAMRSRRDR